MAFDWKKYQTSVDATAQLFNNEFLSDITFQIGISDTGEPQHIHAHSLELMKRSSKFYEMFNENMGTHKLIPILDVDYSTFLDLLRFIYTDKCEINNDNALDVLKAAKEYSVKLLEHKCMQKIVDQLSVDCVCRILEQSIEERYDFIRSKASRYISENYSKVIVHRNFNDIRLETLKCIVKLAETDDIRELDIFYAVMRWAAHECERKEMNVTGANKRQILGELVKHIRFPLLSAEDFGKCLTAEPGLLSDQEISAMFMCITVKKKNDIGFVDEDRKIIKPVIKPTPAKPNKGQENPNSKTSSKRSESHKNKSTGKENTNKPGGSNDKSNASSNDIIHMGNGTLMFMDLFAHHFVTTFTVSKPVTLVGVTVLGTLNVPVKVCVRVQDANTSTVLFSDQLNTLQDKSGIFKAYFTFKTPVQLQSKNAYSIVNFYPENGTKYFSYQPRPIPWKIQLGKNKVEFEFTQISKTLDKIRFD